MSFHFVKIFAEQDKILDFDFGPHLKWGAPISYKNRLKISGSQPLKILSENFLSEYWTAIQNIIL